MLFIFLKDLDRCKICFWESSDSTRESAARLVLGNIILGDSGEFKMEVLAATLESFILLGDGTGEICWDAIMSASFECIRIFLSSPVVSKLIF